MKFQPKIFSLEEANALIPELEALLNRLHGKKTACERLHDMLLMDELLKEAESAKGTAEQSPKEAAGGSGHGEEEALRLDGSILDIQNEIEQIRSFGCIPRNLERGWIDFQGRRDGQIVYFCWRRGETSIRFYSSEPLSVERLPLV